MTFLSLSLPDQNNTHFPDFPMLNTNVTAKNGSLEESAEPQQMELEPSDSTEQSWATNQRILPQDAFSVFCVPYVTVLHSFVFWQFFNP